MKPYRSVLQDEHIRYQFAAARHTNVHCDMHAHVSMEIVLVNEGGLHMDIGEREYDLAAGEAVFVPPFAPHAFRSDTDNRCHVLMFATELVPTLANFLQGHLPTDHRFAVSDESARLVDRLLPQEQGDADELRAQAVLGPLCWDIRESGRFAVGVARPDNLFLQAVDHIHRHFAEDITLESTAAALGVHPVTLSKTFSKNARVSFCSYLNYQRCSYAAEQLAVSGRPITDVALDAGFGSIRNFNRVFGRLYGLTPSQFRAAPTTYTLPIERLKS